MESTKTDVLILLPRCETKRQRNRGTIVWRARRGHYILCPKLDGSGWYARFMPRMRCFPKHLSVSGNIQHYGPYKTRAQALHRLQMHLINTYNKPLLKCMWIANLMMGGAEKYEIVRFQKDGHFKPW